MLQITEDTPPDMLAGAMDLTVHLPNGRSVKMSVKRSMAMMDLLMHIATLHNLQLTENTLEALSMAPSPDHIDKFLPFKPNTPIGLIDTQHIKVIPKTKPVSVKQRMAPQPFESTFRLKVHLPRNQLYVTRVSRNVLLESILKKACEEKNLHYKKYALHHPGNLDEVLDLKLTLNDYQITEVYLVAKGTVNLNQTFSASDLMVLRKEEERKRMQAKTGGGVLNLIFGRNNNKSSMGSGSLSSENRSISPSHSEDSRSATPPAVSQQILTPPPKQDTEKPKPPQRKRRPAPKPPSISESRKNSDIKPPSNISDNSDLSDKKAESNLTICHSRNSSDSSGYHEASILSDNCNTSLPRRPQSAYISGSDLNNLSKQHSQSTTNLSKMSSHSKSTSSLAFAGRKKKAAPPPPPVLKTSTSVTNLVLPSPVVASQAPASIPPTESPSQIQVQVQIEPRPLPRRKPPSSSRSSLRSIEERLKEVEDVEPQTKLEKTVSEEETSVPESSDSNKTLTEQLILSNSSNLSERNEQSPLKNSKSLPNINNLKEPDLNESVRPPEIVGVIPKTQPKLPRKYDTFGRKTHYNIGMSLWDDYDKTSIHSHFSVESETSSVRSALEAFKFDVEYDDINEKLFTGSLSKKSSGSNVFNQLYGIHTHEPIPKEENSESGITKWKNIEELDNLSQHSFIDARNNPVIGSFDTESLTSTNYTQQTPTDSLASYLSQSENTSAPETPNVDEKPVQPEKPVEEINYAKEAPAIAPAIEIETPIKIEESKPEPEEIKKEEPKVEEKKPEPVVKPARVSIPNESQIKQLDETDKASEAENKEIDWQYQLPPPPEGFRDSSYFETTTTQNATVKSSDSVVTSPELFEKLKVLEDNQSEPGTIDSSVPEDDKSVLNTTLSLENLEKRKSLVYNRELATSLKMTDNITDKNDTFTSSLNKFESTFEELSRSSITRNYSTESETKFQPVKRSTSTLPNFKIATYDNPKKNITVFEDDTVRSNTQDSVLKKNIFARKEEPVSSNLTKSSYIGRSMENISFRKNSWGNQSDDDKSKNSFTLYRPQNPVVSKNNFGPSSMHRSESFSTDQHWSPTKPVSRSKSQLTLNKYREEKSSFKSLDPMTKSNSLMDVSGLQSLGVMKLIQNRLKTPTSSLENINHQEKPTIKPETTVEEKPKPVKTYQYRGPPSINLSTWSERPKVQVTLKDDNDYINSSKLIVNTTNNVISNNRIEVNNSQKYNTNYTSLGSVNVRVGNYQPEPKNVTIKVNGTEPISSEKSGNVVIKIGSNNTNGVSSENQRFISHTTAAAYRRPLGNINKPTQRPHSIAVDSDMSHIPVVRSVELKKPYKDMNTSITQIYQNNNNNNTFRSNTVHRNSYEAPQQTYKSTEPETKPVSRVNSFARNFSPIVRGFSSNSENNITNNRYSTNSPNIYTVNKKETDSFTTNKDVPFSQSNLRRTDSNKLTDLEPKNQNGVNNNEIKVNLFNKKNSNYNVYAVNKQPDVIQAPPPPQMPKMEVKKRPRQIEPKEDPRDQLLSAIRNFGGKKGLKSVKG